MCELIGECLQGAADDGTHGCKDVESELLDIYRLTVGEEYFRIVTDEDTRAADALNNKALSFIDLGKKSEAEKLFKEALELVPNHPAALFNQQLLLWRQGKITELDVIRSMEQGKARSDRYSQYKDYIIQIHRERRDSYCADHVENGHRDGIEQLK